MIIDPHVHCRDGKQAYKETIAHVLQLAREQGVEKIFDMPNTDPPVLREEDIKRRLSLVPKGEEGRYFLYIGLTPEVSQIEEAVRCYRQYPQVVGFKLYAGESVGSLGVTNPREQEVIYQSLVRLAYKGVVAVHCERVSYFNLGLWNPEKPITHCQARPKVAEIVATKDQIRFVQKTGFKGILYIVHASCPEVVEEVDKAREFLDIRCAVTLHHIFWSNGMLERPDGWLYKTNPPLRDPADLEGLRRQLRLGMIDWIETDHAPHPVGEKIYPPYASGFPSLYLWKRFIEQQEPILGLIPEQIRKLTSENVLEAFSDKLS